MASAAAHARAIREKVAAGARFALCETRAMAPGDGDAPIPGDVVRGGDEPVGAMTQDRAEDAGGLRDVPGVALPSEDEGGGEEEDADDDGGRAELEPAPAEEEIREEDEGLVLDEDARGDGGARGARAAGEGVEREGDEEEDQGVGLTHHDRGAGLVDDHEEAEESGGADDAGSTRAAEDAGGVGREEGDGGEEQGAAHERPDGGGGGKIEEGEGDERDGEDGRVEVPAHVGGVDVIAVYDSAGGVVEDGEVADAAAGEGDGGADADARDDEQEDGAPQAGGSRSTVLRGRRHADSSIRGSSGVFAWRALRRWIKGLNLGAAPPPQPAPPTPSPSWPWRPRDAAGDEKSALLIEKAAGHGPAASYSCI